MKLGIYIHIPFCKSRCFYCDFCSMVSDDNNIIKEYFNTLAQEIMQNAELLAENEVDTIYIGGGTPSIVPAQYICDILDLISSCTHISDDPEITIELNPESVTSEKLEMYRKSGINRISMGLQSANDNVLKTIGRVTTKQMFLDAYNKIKSAGFTNISTDIICGLPQDNIESFKDTLGFVLKLDSIKHISVYSLELHEKSKLDFLVKNGFATLPDEDTEREMFYIVKDMLKNNSFEMYEISNFAKSGFRSRHNLKYWSGLPYLGFGASASSFINSTRYSNTSDIKEYIACKNEGCFKKCDVEELDLLDLEKEFVILGLRKTVGININEFKSRFKVDINSIFGQEINKFLNNGLLQKNGENIRLTDRGQDLANTVWQEFI